MARCHLVARPCSQFIQDPSKGVGVFPFCHQDLSKGVLVYKEVHPVLRLGNEALQYHRRLPADLRHRMRRLHNLQESVNSPSSFEMTKFSDC